MAKPYIITISSEKGGVGKTTLATNLAIYLKNLAGDLQVTLLSFDNHFTVDRMFIPAVPPQKTKHVARLFEGVDAAQLTCTGEHEVQIIPSCAGLDEIQHQASDDAYLAERLSQSNLNGLVIIDTSPVLNAFTRNALFAADRVIVPVKDAPSLQNCKNLGRYFSDRGLSKNTLRLLPCLIDTRIRYKGPFSDPYQLLKAYAINRGFRCMEGYIAKSPKVESLNTNPEGRVYPILTHGKSTDVHLQFMHLARQVYLEYLEKGPVRINAVVDDLGQKADREARALNERLRRLNSRCPCCGEEIPEKGPWPNAFYLEAAHSDRAGFVEENCLLDLVFSHFYGQHKNIAAQQSMRDLFKESATRSFLALEMLNAGGTSTTIELLRLDEKGDVLSRKSLELKENGYGLLRKTSHPLQQLFERMSPQQEVDGAKLLLLKRTEEDPLTLLQGVGYARFQKVLSRLILDRTQGEKESLVSGRQP